MLLLIVWYKVMQGNKKKEKEPKKENWFLVKNESSKFLYLNLKGSYQTPPKCVYNISDVFLYARIIYTSFPLPLVYFF